jgi:hypothetical protein
MLFVGLMLFGSVSLRHNRPSFAILSLVCLLLGGFHIKLKLKNQIFLPKLNSSLEAVDSHDHLKHVKYGCYVTKLILELRMDSFRSLLTFISTASKHGKGSGPFIGEI